MRPDSPGARYNLGVALTYKEDYDGALAACQKAVALDPKYTEAHVQMGAVLCDDHRDIAVLQR